MAKLRSTALWQTISAQGLRVFTTQDVMSASGLSSSAASVALRRLAKDKLVQRIKKGLWINLLEQGVRAEELVPFLFAPWPAYVSLYSALSDHGLIAEIPHVVFVVTSGRPRKFKTSLGTVVAHHLPREAIFGFEIRPWKTGSYPMAEPEKALLDTLYLASSRRSPVRTPAFRDKPHLDQKKWKHHLKRWNNPRFAKDVLLFDRTNRLF